MRTVDTRGQLCPAPIIATKKALREAIKEETLRVLTDNQTSLNNLTRFLSDNNTQFSVEENGGGWVLTITKSEGEEILSVPENYCTDAIPHLSKGDFIIVFSSDKMGEGDEQLGGLLMNNFIKAIRDMDELPGKMVFYNSGVKLGTDDSEIAAQLREIEKMGVSMYFCATCAKFYSLEEKIKVGVLSNMFEIARLMAAAGKIIKP